MMQMVKKTSVVLLGTLLAAACGSNNITESGSPTATPTGTATPTFTLTPRPTATPTPTSPPAGPELHFGSTARGSGTLALESDDTLNVEVFFSTCLGGTGPNCDGGDAIYIGTDPGFPTIEEDVPEQPLYTLTDGTEVDLLVKSIDQGVSLMFGDMTLDKANASAVLGTAPLHADGSWQVVVPGGTAPTNHMVTLQLTTPSSAYTASVPFTMTLVPSDTTE